MRREGERAERKWVQAKDVPFVAGWFAEKDRPPRTAYPIVGQRSHIKFFSSNLAHTAPFAALKSVMGRAKYALNYGALGEG